MGTTRDGRQPGARREALKQAALVAWYLLLLALIFLLHDFPNREFRYWKL